MNKIKSTLSSVIQWVKDCQDARQAQLPHRLQRARDRASLDIDKAYLEMAKTQDKTAVLRAKLDEKLAKKELREESGILGGVIKKGA